MIYLYNPSTDLALACGGRTFTPKHNVMVFERENMLVPTLYANPGDAILLLYDISHKELISNKLYNSDFRYFTLEDLKDSDESFFPWGWNLALRCLLMKYGYPEKNIPSEKALSLWRMLAHRRTSIRVNEAMGKKDSAMEFFDKIEALDFVRKAQKVMIKLPWSSSGRGILAIRDGDLKGAKRRIDDGINNQGSVIIEPLWDKAVDFATEWISDGRDIRFAGFSLFETDHAERYVRNLVASQDEIINRLQASSMKFHPEKIVEVICDALKSQLIENAEFPYVGPFGVDGLITSEGRILSCIEINLRMTMGHLALESYKRGKF